MKTIKFLIDDEDKEKLEKLAAEKNMAVSAYIREALQGTIKEECGTTLGKAQESYNLPNGGGGKDKSIRVYVSNEEYERFKNDAGAQPLSSYIRELITSKSGNKFIFNIETDDLQELNETMAEINMHVDGFIGALRFRSDIFPVDIERLEALIRETNENVVKLNKEIMKNRESIRKAGRTNLNNRINKIIKDGG